MISNVVNNHNVHKNQDLCYDDDDKEEEEKNVLQHSIKRQNHQFNSELEAETTKRERERERERKKN